MSTSTPGSTRRQPLLLGAAALLLSGVGTALPAGAAVADDAPATPLVSRVSLTPVGQQLACDDLCDEDDAGSFEPSISADGRYVAYTTDRSPLTDSHQWGVFVHDRTSSTTALVSVDADGNLANGSAPRISRDGQHVVYASKSSSIVADDTNGGADIFVWDRATGESERVDLTSEGAQAAYSEEDLEDGRTGGSAAISEDGRYVAFTSRATNLDPSDDNDQADVFLRDRTEGTTTRVTDSVLGDAEAYRGSGRPWISADGRYVTYTANDGSGTDVYVWDRTTGETTTPLSSAELPNLDKGSAVFSPDATYVAVNEESDDAWRVWLMDLASGTLTDVSGPVASSYQGFSGQGVDAVSPDGRFVTYMASDPSRTAACDYSPVPFVWDRDTGETTDVSAAFDGAEADNGDYTWSSANAAGAQVDDSGRFVAYASKAGNLVAGDTNTVSDIFVWDRDGTAVTPEAAPTVTAQPDITGTAAVGETLTASPGEWDADGLTYRYQWLRDGEPIPCETYAGHQVQPADAGTELSVRVRAVSGGRATGVAESESVAIGADPAPTVITNLAPPTIAGTAQVGRSLTASPGTWSPSPSTVALQWLRNGKAIAGASRTTYALTAADRGASITVRATASKAGLTNGAATSTPTKPVAAGVIVGATPRVTGTVKVGRKVAAAAGSTNPTGVRLTYQWLRNGKPIAGATRSTYTVAKADRKRKIAVRVTRTKAGYTTLVRTSTARKAT